MSPPKLNREVIKLPKSFSTGRGDGVEPNYVTPCTLWDGQFREHSLTTPAVISKRTSGAARRSEKE